MDNKDLVTDEPNILSASNQNFEEAEELEDRKRREEELHKLLSHAMGEFTYDDESTMNSSVASNNDYKSVGSSLPPVNFEAQYREVDPNEQLKVLYEVRVREVTALNKQLERFQEQFQKQEQLMKKKFLLLEAENEQKKISLKETQNLLIDKVEKIKILEKQLHDMNVNVNKLEMNNTELKEENLILQETNMKLDQQLVLMDRGFPLLNKTSDKELLGSQQNKIAQLENSLEQTVLHYEHKEQLQKELIRDLRENLQEKIDCLTEKDALINKLTENFHNAQQKCHDLMTTIEELRKIQKSAKSKDSPLEEELRKIREYNERTDILCENVKNIVSKEFMGQIANLNSENQMLRNALQSQTTDINDIMRGFQMIKIFENENVETGHTELEDNFKKIKTYPNILGQKLQNYEDDMNALKQKCRQLIMDNEQLSKCKQENETNVRIPHTVEKAIETSFLAANTIEICDLYKEKEEMCNNLFLAHAVIAELEGKMKYISQENAKLLGKVGLEQERDILIKKLQKKATEFEQIILKRQTESSKCKAVSVGTNTESDEENGSVLKMQYDALLYQTESRLRCKLKQEFDEKLRNALQKIHNKSPPDCNNCNEARNENKRICELRADDRKAVTKLVERWMEKFDHMSKKSQESLKLMKKEYEENLASCVGQCERLYSEESIKIRQESKKLLMDSESQKSKLIYTNLCYHNTLKDRISKISMKLQQGNREIAFIQEQGIRK